MRKINIELFNGWLDHQDEDGIALLALETGISTHTLNKMKGGGYQSEPSPLVRKAICNVTELEENKLFPIVKEVS